MSKFFAKELSRLVPYTPGEQLSDKKYVKLNTNESPYPPSPKALQAVNSEKLNSLKLYSDPTADVLHGAIADFYRVKKENVIASNGSDEVLAFIFRAFCDGFKGMVFPDVTYGFYTVFCDLFGIRYRQIPLDENFDVRVEDYYETEENVVLANPNAQTGKFLGLDKIEKLLQSNRERVVVIDEAYVDFGGESAVGLIGKYDNLIVVRTFSKSRNLAGLRVGFAIANEKLIVDVNTVKYSFNPYNVGTLGQTIAAESVKDVEYFKECTARIIQSREYLTKELTLRGFNVVPSLTNFILAESPKLSGKELYLRLKDKGILVRYLGIKRIENFVRITIGSDEDVKKLIKSIDEITE